MTQQVGTLQTITSKATDFPIFSAEHAANLFEALAQCYPNTGIAGVMIVDGKGVGIYKVDCTVVDGEHEHGYDFCLFADNQNEAEAIAKDMLTKDYTDPDDTWDEDYDVGSRFEWGFGGNEMTAEGGNLAHRLLKIESIRNVLEN